MLSALPAVMYPGVQQYRFPQQPRDTRLPFAAAAGGCQQASAIKGCGPVYIMYIYNMQLHATMLTPWCQCSVASVWKVAAEILLRIKNRDLSCDLVRSHLCETCDLWLSVNVNSGDADAKSSGH